MRLRVMASATSMLTAQRARLVGTLVCSAIFPQITAPSAAPPMIDIW